jgi:hypothetical protein
MKHQFSQLHMVSNKQVYIMEAKTQTTSQSTCEEALPCTKQTHVKKQLHKKIQESCPICMDSIGTTNCAKTSCGHSFCLSCIVKCLDSNHVCPLCREDIVEKKEQTAGKKLKMDDAVRIIEDEMDNFGLHAQLSMARQFGLRALKSVVQSFALSTAHSIALMQDEGEVDGSWLEIEDEDEYASEADASEADASEDDASDADSNEDSDSDEDDESAIEVEDDASANDVSANDASEAEDANANAVIANANKVI